MNATFEIKTNGHNKTIDQNPVTKKLSQVLAETYTLSLKTQSFHWNVTGPMFQPLHSLFEEQYSELARAVDEMAERIRALGQPAPGSFKEFQILSSIKCTSEKTNSWTMIQELLEGHVTISQTANNAFNIAQKAGDEGTADLMVQRIQMHDKTAWMLRSFMDIE
jgi:starvation-inducible DNA-binding protein